MLDSTATMLDSTAPMLDSTAPVDDTFNVIDDTIQGDFEFGLGHGIGIVKHEVAVATEHLVEEMNNEDESDGDCGCGCASVCDPCGEHTTNIPDAMYLDPSIK